MTDSAVCDLTRLSTKERSASWSLSGRHQTKDRNRDMPGPGSYPLKSFIESSLDRFNRAPAVGFNGYGRPSRRPPCSVPPPGTYDPVKLDTSPKFSMKGRWHEFAKKNDGPGPASYSPEPVKTMRGVHIQGRWSSKRPASSVPGPGSYSPQSLDRGKGVSFGVGVKLRPLTARVSAEPGSYNLPSSLDTKHGVSLKGKWRERKVSIVDSVGVISTQFTCH